MADLNQTYAELDLDALQREQEVIAAYPWWSEPETPRTDPAKIAALIAELRAARKVVEAARWYQQCRDNVERRVRVAGMDEAREGLRAALAKVESNRD